MIIESAEGNSGAMYVAFSENDASSIRRHWLQVAGEAISLSSDPYADLNAEINLKDIWFDGEIAGDRLIVSYIEIELGTQFI